MKKILTLLALFALLVPFQSTQAVDVLSNYDRITAHRGSSGSAPENTLSAVLQAAQDGAGYAEIDVQMSVDGVIVLYHDRKLSKLGIDRNVTDMRYDEMLTADIGGWFSADFSGERIPTLDLIMEAAYPRIKLNIELKMYDPLSPLPEAVANMIMQKNFIDRSIVTSFDLQAIERVKQVNPAIRTGLIISRKKAITTKIWTSNIDILSVKSKLVDRKLVKQASSSGKELHAWTVNKKSEMRRLLRFDIASIITDYPGDLYQIVKRR